MAQDKKVNNNNLNINWKQHDRIIKEARKYDIEKGAEILFNYIFDNNLIGQTPNPMSTETPDQTYPVKDPIHPVIPNCTCQTVWNPAAEQNSCEVQTQCDSAGLFVPECSKGPWVDGTINNHDDCICTCVPKPPDTPLPEWCYCSKFNCEWCRSNNTDSIANVWNYKCCGVCCDKEEFDSITDDDYGQIDPDNFDPGTGDEDDNSLLTAGCTDIYAANYNVDATIDDGSCCYDNDCLALLGWPEVYGTEVGGGDQADMNGDGVVNILDIVMLVNCVLGGDGYSCIPGQSYYIPPYHDCGDQEGCPEGESCCENCCDGEGNQCVPDDWIDPDDCDPVCEDCEWETLSEGEFFEGLTEWMSVGYSADQGHNVFPAGPYTNLETWIAYQAGSINDWNVFNGYFVNLFSYLTSGTYPVIGTNFIDTYCPSLPVLGCTDSSQCDYGSGTTNCACNYDPSAQQNDGTCQYPAVGFGCDCDNPTIVDTCWDTDMPYCDDGSQCTEIAYGCTDTSACNYDSSANTPCSTEVAAFNYTENLVDFTLNYGQGGMYSWDDYYFDDWIPDHITINSRSSLTIHPCPEGEPNCRPNNNPFRVKRLVPNTDIIDSSGNTDYIIQVWLSNYTAVTMDGTPNGFISNHDNSGVNAGFRFELCGADFDWFGSGSNQCTDCILPDGEIVTESWDQPTGPPRVYECMYRDGACRRQFNSADFDIDFSYCNATLEFYAVAELDWGLDMQVSVMELEDFSSLSIDPPTTENNCCCYIGDEFAGDGETVCGLGGKCDCDGHQDYGCGCNNVMKVDYYYDPDDDGLGCESLSVNVCPPAPAGYVENFSESTDQDCTCPNTCGVDGESSCINLCGDCEPGAEEFFTNSSCAGCTDASACNYDPTASIDEGCYYGQSTTCYRIYNSVSTCYDMSETFTLCDYDNDGSGDCSILGSNWVNIQPNALVEELTCPSDDTACNYTNPLSYGDCYIDGGGCTYPEEGYDCDGNCLDGVEDCNGDCGGEAVVDDCGICSGGNTGHVADSDKDLCNVCFGNNATDLGCGCDNPPISYWWPDTDGDGLAQGVGQLKCSAIGTITPNTCGNGSDDCLIDDAVWEQTCLNLDTTTNTCNEDAIADCASNVVDGNGDCCDSGIVDSCGVCGGDGCSCVSCPCPDYCSGDTAYSSGSSTCTGGTCSACSYSSTDECEGDGCDGDYCLDDPCAGDDFAGCPEGETCSGGVCSCVSGLTDCFDICDGTSVEDACGVCGGSAVICVDGWYDYTGLCTENSTTYCDCSGNNTFDCEGTCGGDVVEDDCGNCGGTCVSGNYGTCTGTEEILLSTCGQCGGPEPDDHYNCEGVCIESIDAYGTCCPVGELDSCNVCSGSDDLDLCGVCVSEGADVSVCGGCTNPIGNNYDETALWDDGSCTFTYGCTHSGSDNYNEDADMCLGGDSGEGSSCCCNFSDLTDQTGLACLHLVGGSTYCSSGGDYTTYYNTWCDNSADWLDASTHVPTVSVDRFVGDTTSTLLQSPFDGSALTNWNYVAYTLTTTESVGILSYSFYSEEPQTFTEFGGTLEEYDIYLQGIRVDLNDIDHQGVSITVNEGGDQKGYSWWGSSCIYFGFERCENGWGVVSGSTGELSPGQGFLMTSSTFPGSYLKFYFTEVS